MSTKRALRLAGLLVALTTLAFLPSDKLALTPNALAPPSVQGFSFSVAAGDPLTATNISPADILGISGMPLIACEHLGLWCRDAPTVAEDDVQALSFGYDFIPMGLPPIQFSVAPGSQGMAGSAVSVEAACIPPEPHSDMFGAAINFINIQYLDGNGVSCGGNAGYGLYILEGVFSDQVDSLERDPCQFVDLNCDGLPENPIYFTLGAGSPSLVHLGVSTSDILMSGVEYAAMVWADGVTDLGLVDDDVVDAICVYENGNGVFDPGDRVLFSLAAGSPTLATWNVSAADLLRPATKAAFYEAGDLGLQDDDDLDAVICGGELKMLEKLYFPAAYKGYSPP